MSENNTVPNPIPEQEAVQQKSENSDSKSDPLFDLELIRKYPKSNRKISLSVAKFGLSSDEVPDHEQNCQSMHISPYGIEFRTNEEFTEGALLKIHVNIPDYWQRKQKLVDYTRIDAPKDFRVLAKVVKTEDLGKRSKKRVITVQTLVIDDVDEQVLKTFLQDG